MFKIAIGVALGIVMGVCALGFLSTWRERRELRKVNKRIRQLHPPVQDSYIDPPNPYVEATPTAEPWVAQMRAHHAQKHWLLTKIF